jgi:hypothetical protein
MLEQEGVLRTWTLAVLPDGTKLEPAEALTDHRLAYLEYEGPVSGDRGMVSRWDAGEYETLEESPTRLCVQLHGTRWRGKLTLERGDANAQRWFCGLLAD